MTQPNPDGPPPKKRSTCMSCGGTGLDNGDVDAPSHLDLPIETRELWDKQLQNRPEIYRSMDATLAYRWKERLECMETLGEFISATDHVWDVIRADYITANEMPVGDRGRILRGVLFRLLTIGADVAWFLSIQGYPKRGSVGRLIREFASTDYQSDNESDDDEDGPITGNDWKIT